jgi:hypothetical protein
MLKVKQSICRCTWTFRKILYIDWPWVTINRTELWGLRTEAEEGYRTGSPGDIGWRNSFLGIDSGAPYTFENTSSAHLHIKYVLFGSGTKVPIQYMNGPAKYSTPNRVQYCIRRTKLIYYSYKICKCAMQELSSTERTRTFGLISQGWYSFEIFIFLGWYSGKILCL